MLIDRFLEDATEVDVDCLADGTRAIAVIARRPTRLNMTSTVDLRTPSTYDVTITRDSGDGQWTCKDVAGSPVLLGYGSSADVKHHARVTYVADADKETWRFTWPEEATFLVRVLGGSGKVTEEQDLSDSNELDLYAGGSFTLEVAPTDGSGDFTATKSE